MRCPRQAETPPTCTWADRECSWVESDGVLECDYCGSIHPDALFAAIDRGVEITPTDKDYKVYVGGPRKFYFQHLSTEEQRRFVNLLNERKITIGYPGHFYVRPFFVRTKPVPSGSP